MSSETTHPHVIGNCPGGVCPVVVGRRGGDCQGQLISYLHKPIMHYRNLHSRNTIALASERQRKPMTVMAQCHTIPMNNVNEMVFSEIVQRIIELKIHMNRSTLYTYSDFIAVLAKYLTAELLCML